MDYLDSLIFNNENISSESSGLLIIVLSLLFTRYILDKISERYPEQYHREWKYYIPIIGLGLVFTPFKFLLGIPNYFGICLIILTLIKIYRDVVS